MANLPDTENFLGINVQDITCIYGQHRHRFSDKSILKILKFVIKWKELHTDTTVLKVQYWELDGMHWCEITYIKPYED